MLLERYYPTTRSVTSTKSGWATPLSVLFYFVYFIRVINKISIKNHNMSRNPKLEEFEIDRKPSRFQSMRGGSDFFTRKHSTSRLFDKTPSKHRSAKDWGEFRY